MSRHILVTGAAGFIGFHLSRALLASGDKVTGFDNLNDYYDVSLKDARLAILQPIKDFSFIRGDIADRKAIESLFENSRFDIVIHLAAQAGVRHSITNPYPYVESNISGFLNILEGCRHNGINHLLFASSSSVYGANRSTPFSVHDNVDHPVSLYAATKKSNELMAHAYSAMYGIPVTGLRFFTVYGPWGRPDMAYYSFTKAIIEGRPIELFNNGMMMRDFTYIDDVVEGIIRVADHPATADAGWDGGHPDPGSSFAPWKLYNIGNNRPVKLLYFIETIEKCLGISAVKRFMPMQLGDVPVTFADIDDLVKDTGFRPSVSIEEGIRRFVEWYNEYHSLISNKTTPHPNHLSPRGEGA